MTLPAFIGSKGGGGTFKQTPDNLRSNDTFEAVLGVGIGPLKGPTRGLKSIKLDGTALENADGSLNYGDFLCNIGDGDPMKWPQTITLKLGAGSAPTNVGVSLTNPGTGASPGPWVVRTLNNTNADYIDLRLIANQIFRQDKKGVYTTTATIEIQMKPVGKTNWIAPNLNTPAGSYSQNGVDNGSFRTLVPREYYDDNGQWPTTPASSGYPITGKTAGSPAVYELRIAVPSEGAYADTAWDVRLRLVERETLDEDPNIEKRSITWESMAAVYAGDMGTHVDWRGVAWMQLYGKASDQLTGVPEVEGEWDTKIVAVPPRPLFDPDSRVYAPGTWDGSFARAYTNDPAWCLNDLISDGLSGLSLIAPGSFLNKWDALEASQWFSEGVPDGNGGLEPRYSMNLRISSAQKAEDLIRYVAGAAGALAWDEGDGQWRMKCDKPDVPVDLFTPDNTIGEIVYSHTDVDTRFNDITMVFTNAEMDYREDRVRLYDNASIAKIGRKPTSVVAVGCTGRQEAMRRGKLRLESTTGETKIVNLTTNRRGRNIDHLDLFLVADPDLGSRDAPTIGRAVSIAADRRSLVLRDPVFVAAGLAYNVVFSAPNPGYQSSPVSQPPEHWKKPTFALYVPLTNAGSQAGIVRELHFATALPANVDLNLSIALQAVGLPTNPKLYRATNITIDDDGERVSISGLEVNILKWDRSDNVSKSDTVFQDLRGAVPAPLPPISGPVLALQKTPIEQGFFNSLLVSWQRPAGAFLSGSKITHRVNGGPWQPIAERIQQSSFEILNPVPGDHEVRIEMVDRRGGLSAPLMGSATVTQDQLDASSLTYADGTPIEFWKPAAPGATRNVFKGVHDPAVSYAIGDEVTNADNSRSYVAKAVVPAGIALTNTVYWDLRMISGGGAAGDASVDVRLTNSVIAVPTDADGSGGDYSNLTCQVEVYDGTIRKDQTGTVTFALVGAPSYASITSTGLITIGNWGTTAVDLKVDATYRGVTYRTTVRLLRTLAGRDGPSMSLVGGGAFSFVDGASTPSQQTLTFRVIRQKLDGDVVWTTDPPNIPLTGSGDTRVLSVDAIGNLQQVTVRAAIGSLYDEDIAIRTDRSTAEAGATVGAPAGTSVAGREVELLLYSVDINTVGLLEESLRQDDYLRVMDARTLTEGQPVSTTFLNFRNDQKTLNTAIATNFNLLGAKGPDGTTWSLNLDSVQVGPGMSMARHLQEVGAVIDGAEVSVKFLQDIFVGDGQLNARTVLQAEADGVVGAFSITADGRSRRSTITFVGDEFNFVDTNRGNATRPFRIVGGMVIATNFQADTITYDSLVMRFTEVGRQRLDLSGWFQEIPGGLVMMGGRIRQPINSETTFTINFPKPFKNQVLSVGAMPYLNSFSNLRDLYMQNIGEPTLSGTVFGTQASTKNSQRLDGFDWWAWGN